jgi:1-pyrroline-5-carboxylate dehydrogenase
MSGKPAFATVDPHQGMNASQPGVARNLLGGLWQEAKSYRADIPDPLFGGEFLRVPDTTDIDAFAERLRGCPKTGLHNPWKNPQRYVELGAVCARAAARLAQQDVEDYFTRLIQRVMPKSWNQCRNEVTVCASWRAVSPIPVTGRGRRAGATVGLTARWQ